MQTGLLRWESPSKVRRSAPLEGRLGLLGLVDGRGDELAAGSLGSGAKSVGTVIVFAGFGVGSTSVAVMKTLASCSSATF
jgi:hypothetical protein